ncbi:MAG: iron chelate uptake ABC transporter family permease subunit [Aeromicrobium erythreum]
MAIDLQAPPESLATTRSGRRGRRRHVAVVTGLLGVVAFALFVATMMIGSFPVTVWEVVASTFRLSSDPSVDFVVRDLRLPAASTALAVGLALGVSGLVFQKILANPLASPDFVGISAGASLAAVSSIILLNVSALFVSGAALVGALVASLLIYLLAWRDGVTGYRFILVGIGISELLVSLTGYLLARADIFEAREAMTWLVGSVGNAGAPQLRLLLVVLAVLLPLTLVLNRHLDVLELGDDAAHALGVRVETMRLLLLGIAVVLVALAVAVAGPLPFVALIAGPIAVRLIGANGSGLLAAAFVGAVMVLLADIVANHLLPVPLPTGVVTGAIGAPYLIWLLATVNREGRGG